MRTPQNSRFKIAMIKKETFMKRNLFLTLAIAGLLCLTGQLFKVAAHSSSQDNNLFTPQTIPWGPPPPFISPGSTTCSD